MMDTTEMLSTRRVFANDVLFAADIQVCCAGRFHSPIRLWAEGETISFTGIDEGDPVTLDFMLNGFFDPKANWTGALDRAVILGNATCAGCTDASYGRTATCAQIGATSPEPRCSCRSSLILLWLLSAVF